MLRRLSKRLGWAIKHQLTYWRLQREASKLTGAKRVTTTTRRQVWMTAIERRLYGAMIGAGLVPHFQYCVRGFFLDFAFPEVKIGIEADGAAYHHGQAAGRDQWRDRILQQNGWTIVRYTGSEIYRKPYACAEQIGKRVEERLAVKTAERRARLMRTVMFAGGGLALVVTAELIAGLHR